MISTRKIVKVDLDIVASGRTLGDFQTVVYIAPVSLQDKEGNNVSQLLITGTDALGEDTSREGAITGSEVYIQSIKNYFANGGIKLIVAQPGTYDLDGFKNVVKNAKKLDSDFIYVCIANSAIGGADNYQISDIQSIANYCDNSLSPNKIRIIITTGSKTFLEDYDLTDTYTIVKYCTKVVNDGIIDAGLLIGAYFSQMNLDGTDTIKDYDYTAEKLIIPDLEGDYAEDDLDDADFERMVNNTDGTGYYNFIGVVGTHRVNFGGNLATNENIALHTDFGAIAIERDITYSTLEKMLGKQYLTEQGISNIKAAINAKLQRYKTNGYLNPGAGYSGEDLVIGYNGVKYNVIKHGETLTQGFYIFSVPMQNLSVDDKAKRRFTPIYVVLETQSGARVVEITGEVR